VRSWIRSRSTARALAAAGAEVILAVRSTAAGAAVADTIKATTGTTRPHVLRLDLADPGSVAAFTAAWQGPLHLLINNAGLVTGGLERTPQGRELQLATNHLGHFALATGLHHALASGATDRNGARVVTLSSTAHMRAGVDFDDLDFQRRPYDPQIAYAQSKTANSLFSVEATRRWARDGIVANTVNPGGVATGLQRSFTPQQRASLDAAAAAGVFAYKTVEQGAATTMVAAVAPQLADTGGHDLDAAAAAAAGVFAYKTVEQGAATTMVAAVAPQLADTGGHDLDDAQEAYTVGNDATLDQHPHGVKEWALNPALAEQPWEVSANLLHV